jgi:ribonuclease R
MARNRKEKNHETPKGGKTFETSLLRLFATNPFESYNHKQVSARLGIHDKATKTLVSDLIFKLSQSGALLEEKRGKYRINPKFITPDLVPKNYIEGRVDMKPTSKAYIIQDDSNEEDIFIAANNTGRAMDGDRVRVHLFPRRKSRKVEGQIIEILERAKTQFVGTILASKKMAFMLPDNPKMPVDFLIPMDSLNGATDGQKVLIKMVDWPEHSKNPVGEVIHVLGNPGENNVEMQSILAEFGFPLAFPDEVESEAARIPDTISAEEIAKRRDFRNILTFTIDPIDAKDFDDAISFQKLENGHYEVGVHIADVSHYVHPKTALEDEAYERATSVYLVDRVIPMLPEKLSNGVCSLRPHEEKLCFSAVFEMNDKAEILHEWIGKTVIFSDRRFNYDEVQKIIETKEGEYVEEILKVHQLAQIMRSERFKEGAINFNSVEVKFHLDENAKPIGVYLKEQKESNQLIEEFMLLANKKVAEFIGKPKGKQTPKTFVYRVHDEPNPEKLGTFVQFLSKLGYKMRLQSRKTLADSFNNLFRDIAGKGEETMVESIAIRTMSKAYYSTDNIGHYGLSFPYYSHFTSPIRRYPDLMVHRLLERYMEGKPSVEQASWEARCKHASEMEKKAAEAERASVKYKQAEYLKERIGQEFDGIISGVTKWGLFVELAENRCEGMVPLRALDDDMYVLDDDNYRVVGRRNGKIYQLGNKVRIRVTHVDLNKKQMDFVMVEDER